MIHRKLTRGRQKSFTVRREESQGIRLEDGRVRRDYTKSKQYEMKDHLERKPAESQLQPLQTLMDWCTPSLLLLSFITESGWGGNTDEIRKCCAKPGIGLLALVLSVVSYFLHNWVSGLKSGITLSTQNIASSYKSCVHPRNGPCPFLCITASDNDIILWNTVRGRRGKA